MDGKFDWLAKGAINPIPPRYRDWEKNDYEHPTATAGKRSVEAPKEAA